MRDHERASFPHLSLPVLHARATMHDREAAGWRQQAIDYDRTLRCDVCPHQRRKPSGAYMLRLCSRYPTPVELPFGERPGWCPLALMNREAMQQQAACSKRQAAAYWDEIATRGEAVNA